MRVMSPAELQDLSTRIFDAAGSPHDESAWVAEVLVRSSLFGHDSHGIQRIPQYIKDIGDGSLKPDAPFEIVRETRAMAIVDGHRGWGHVIARKAMELAMQKAREVAIGTVSIRGSNHIGRVGEYPALAAAQG